MVGPYPSSVYEDTLEAGVPCDEGDAEEERDETLHMSRPGIVSAEGGDMERFREL